MTIFRDTIDHILSKPRADAAERIVAAHKAELAKLREKVEAGKPQSNLTGSNPTADAMLRGIRHAKDEDVAIITDAMNEGV
jgi:prephenate dehydratase